jgi:iron complex transport system ATP-binding protein
MSDVKKPTTTSILKSEQLAIGYCSKKGTHYVAENLNLKLKRGQLVCLLGKNGVGKSTLLRTLSKTQHKLGGTIFLEDRDLSEIDSGQLAQKMSLVLTEKIPESQLTVFELVALGRQPYTNWLGKLSSEDHQKVDTAIQQVKLEALSHRNYFELSDGQLQKVMIARALAQDTDLILLDEPTAHLDLHHTIEVFQLLKDLATNTNKTILISTHEVNLALALADDLWLMRPDKFVSGSTANLIESQDLQNLFPSEQLTFNEKLKQFVFRTQNTNTGLPSKK